MSITKQYLKNKRACNVTFNLPEDAAGSARFVNIVGEFNDWNVEATPMKVVKKGGFTATVTLDTNREYQFRYLLDDENWKNDDNADKYVHSDFGNCENSVVVI